MWLAVPDCHVPSPPCLPNQPPKTAVRRATAGVWRAATQSICDLLLSLLRRLPFVPSDLGRKHWPAPGAEGQHEQAVVGE